MITLIRGWTFFLHMDGSNSQCTQQEKKKNSLCAASLPLLPGTGPCSAHVTAAYSWERSAHNDNPSGFTFL